MRAIGQEMADQAKVMKDKLLEMADDQMAALEQFSQAIREDRIFDANRTLQSKTSLRDMHVVFGGLLAVEKVTKACERKAAETDNKYVRAALL